MTNNQAAIAAERRVSHIEAAILAVEWPVRRLGWYLRTSGIIERTTVRIAAATLLAGAVGSVVWLATSFFVAL